MKQFICNLIFLLFITAGNIFAGNPKIIKSELLYKTEAFTGEGSIWHPERKSLFWIDIEGKTLFEYLPALKSCHSWKFDRMISTVVPETDNTVIVALQNEIVRVNLADGTTTSVAPIPDDGGILRCNDGKCDPEGRFWIGTMTLKAPKGSAALYCVLPDGTVTSKLSGVTISNGIVWTSDKKYMYYNDTPTGQIARYQYDAKTGNIVFDGIAVTVPPNTGMPDGMTIDRNDNLWVAQWGGYGVYCYNPKTGELLAKVEVPAPNVASCTFGGKNMDELYITTARAQLASENLVQYPLSGSLFCCKPGVKGAKINCFKK